MIDDPVYAEYMRTTAYQYLVRCLLPYLFTTPLTDLRLRGVVRTNDGHARIALSVDATLSSGVALDIDLRNRLQGYEMEYIVDFVRSSFAPKIPTWLDTDLPIDSHDNIVVSEHASGLLDTDKGSALARHPSRALHDLLMQALGQSYSPMNYDLIGFMLLDAQTCRIYLRTATEGVVGIHLTTNAPGVSGTFATELDSYAETANLLVYPHIDAHDDYCTTIVDMTQLVDPPYPTRRHKG